MIYYAKIGTQLCFTLEVPIRVCFRKRKKTFVIKSSAQQRLVLLRRAPLKLYTNDLLFMEKCTYQGRLQIQKYLRNISTTMFLFNFSSTIFEPTLVFQSSKTYCYRILLHTYISGQKQCLHCWREDALLQELLSFESFYVCLTPISCALANSDLE